MSSCPACGAPLSNLDVPCPFCDDHEDYRRELTHEYSQSFTTRWAFQPDIDLFVAELNRWLLAQPNLIWVEPQIHWAPTGAPRGATFTCRGSSVDHGLDFQLHRVRIGERISNRPDLGTALNDWADRNPTAQAIWRQTIEPAGVPVELWILSCAPRGTALPPAPVERTRRFLGVHRLPAAIVFGLSATFALLAMVAGQGGTFVACLAVAVPSGWLSSRYPVVRLRSASSSTPARSATSTPRRS